MIYDVGEIIRGVRVALDMNRSDASLMEEGDTDTLSLDELIESKLEQGARAVAQRAPRQLLDAGKPLGGSITFREAVGKGRGRMQLPDDFLRLITFKMSDWARAVTEPITEQSAEYGLQSSRWAGVRGTPERPVAALVAEPTGLVLEFWSCEGGEGVTLQRGRYLPIPRIRGGNIEICEKLLEATLLHTGYLTLLTLGEGERAQGLLAQSNEMLGA